jgi:uncharacterized protein CbrC (UPF0167 family)
VATIRVGVKMLKHLGKIIRVEGCRTLVYHIYEIPPEVIEAATVTCTHCCDSKMEYVYGGHGNVLEIPCSMCEPV